MASDRLATCRACCADLPAPAKGRYAICGNCGSLNLVSEFDASEDNLRYFDEVYARAPVESSSRYQDLYAFFERIHNRLFRSQIESFDADLQRLDRLVRTAGKVLEIGFGYGEQLVRWLKEGADAYGVELSHEALAKFKSQFPDYADRVLPSFADLGTKHFPVIYSSALFEHLEDPSDFLTRCRKLLSPDGVLVFRFPAIVDGVSRGRLLRTRDINEWDPCHRGLYTRQGIEHLMRRTGFRLVRCGRSDYFGYKVMSAMLQKGISEVEYCRSPTVSYPALRSRFTYILVLISALAWRLVCAEFIVVMAPDRKYGTTA